MYKNEEYHNIAGKRSLLDIILDVHTTITGSYDRSRESQERDFRALEIALETWTDNDNPKFAEFDYNVNRLLNIVIEEYKKYYHKPKIKSLQIQSENDKYWDSIEIDENLTTFSSFGDVSFKTFNEDTKEK